MSSVYVASALDEHGSVASSVPGENLPLLFQPPGFCYLYVALEGLNRSELGQQILAESFRADAYGVTVRFRPSLDAETVYEFSNQQIRDYERLFPRDDVNPPYCVAMEMAYNCHLAGQTSGNYDLSTVKNEGGCYRTFRHVGGTTSEFLRVLCGARHRMFWVPTEKPSEPGDLVDLSEKPTEENNAPALKAELERLVALQEKYKLIISIGTRGEISANPIGLTEEQSGHALLLEHLTDIGDPRFELVFSNLQFNSQRGQFSCTSEQLLPFLSFIDTAFLDYE